MHWTTDGVNWRGPIPLYTWSGGENFDTAPAAVSWDGLPNIFIGDVNCCAASLPILRQYKLNANGLTASWSNIPAPDYPATTARASAIVWKNSLYLAWVSSYNQIAI